MLPKPSRPNSLVVAIPWYRPKDYGLIRAVSEDGEKMSPTFDQWLAESEESEFLMQRQGKRVVRVVIIPQQFMSWCGVHQLKPNHETRNRFAKEHAAGGYENPGL